ncbi:hypothetical protein TSUD_249980 [Trifolium subterraneum]|nr:hypothetical protein TSUD_249980 [Trifolium subterraneum]
MQSVVTDILRHVTDSGTIQHIESLENIPFPCDCINGEFLGHTFLYELQVADFMDSKAEFTLSNLTTEDYLDEWMGRYNDSVTVNCSCGNRGVSKDYGLFITYTLRNYGLFITYPLYSAGTLESIVKDTKLDAELLKRYNFSQGSGSIFITGKDLMVEKSQEFSYKELSIATNKFSMSNKIGEGGFGEVFYAELRGQVGLIGYCVEGFLFLVYEYIDNGNLSQNLRDSEREPLTWCTRMQIALDSARCLEYIHEHTEHVYIHRDIKYARGGVAPSPKIDVYAFGVVLYELISAKQAVIRDGPEVKGLVALVILLYYFQLLS